MATRKIDIGGEKHGKIEIAYVRLEGNDATLQDAVRAFSALINRPSSGNGLHARRVNALPGTPSNGSPNGEVASDDESVAVETDEIEETERSATVVGPRAARKYAVPTAIPIDTETEMPLSNFVARYKLENDNDRYVALAAWLKIYRNQIPLKAGLIITLYHASDWKLQADVTMPLRRLASKKFQRLENVGRGDYQISQIGEQHLAKLKV